MWFIFLLQIFWWSDASIVIKFVSFNLLLTLINGTYYTFIRNITVRVYTTELLLDSLVSEILNKSE